MTDNLGVDEAGRRVLSFMGKVENLGRIGDLTKAIVEMAESDDWRDYRTALGRERWRPSEFDYFLVAMGVRQEDARSVIAWNEKSAKLAPLMNPNANGRQRRSIEQAAESWHAPGPESFLARAQRLGWIDRHGGMRPAVSRRARQTIRAGMTNEEHALRARAERIAKGRRTELDRLVRQVLAEFQSDDERRYVIDQLRRSNTDWRADAEKLEWKAAALAEHWGVTHRQAWRRIKKLRETA